MEVNYDIYKAEDFICEKCGWKGKGKELINVAFSIRSLEGT